MSVYTARDIAVSFEGDIQLDPNGDIKLANSYESHKAAVNYLLRTDKGDFKPDKRVGCDLGSFIGENNLDETYLAMEDSSIENISKFVLDRTDFSVHVVPIAINEAGVYIVVGGSYMGDDGALLDTEPEILTYIFPFLDGSPRFLSAS